MNHDEFMAKRRERCVTAERAKLAAQRLIDASFRNAGKERPHFHVPVELDDDDIVIMDFIAQCEGEECP